MAHRIVTDSELLGRLLQIRWMRYLPNSTAQANCLANGWIECYDRKTGAAAPDGLAVRLTAAGLAKLVGERLPRYAPA